jgi:hypothetical protein
MRQHPLQVPATPPAEPGPARRWPARWRQGAWALGASVLVHALALEALTAVPKEGPPRALARSEQADAGPLSPIAKVAVLTAARQPVAPQDVRPTGTAAPADAAGKAEANARDLATKASIAPPKAADLATRRPVPGTPDMPTAPMASTSAAGAAPLSASSAATPTTPKPASEGSAPSTAGSSSGMLQATTGLAKDPGTTTPSGLASGQTLAAASPLAAAAPLTGPRSPAGGAAGPSTAATAAAADEDNQPPPVYATRTPPPFRLTYALKRGAMSGQAELSLKRPGAGYELDLKGTVLGMEVLGMSSRGSFGAQGFMPERFVDRRRGKDRLAANFDHAAGRITYSGPPVAQPLLPGAQDRLSWMVQLAAILEAAPARYPAGSRIAMSVSGARGDVDTWTFIVQGRQRLSLPGGAVVDTLRLTREPRRPYDTQVETWLDPAQHHLPVRARLTVLPGGETLELSLAGS